MFEISENLGEKLFALQLQDTTKSLKYLCINVSSTIKQHQTFDMPQFNGSNITTKNKYSKHTHFAKLNLHQDIKFFSAYLSLNSTNNFYKQYFTICTIARLISTRINHITHCS